MYKIDSYDFKGKRAIIRVDFNVPLDAEGRVTDDTRIRAAIPTIEKVLEGGGSVILMSHLGRPKKNNDTKFSLAQIIPAIEARLGRKVLFAGDAMGDKAAEMARGLKPGEVMLLQSLAERVRRAAGFVCRLLHQRRFRHSPPRPRLDGADRRLFSTRQDVRVRDGERTAGHRLHHGEPAPSVLRRAGRIEGLDQNLDHRKAHGKGRFDRPGRRHDLHL